jgi:MFS family permease
MVLTGDLQIMTQVLNKKYYMRAAFICSLAALFYVYEFTVRTMPTAMTGELMRDFHISAAGLGIMASMFYWGYTFMQIPAGLLCDRFGVRGILTISMGLCTAGTFLFSLSDNIYFADFAFLIIGVASSTAFVGALVLVARWFPPKYFAMMVGMVQFLGCIGAIMGVGPIVLLVQRISWHGTVHWFVAVGALITVLMGMFIRSQPENAKTIQKKAIKKEFSMTEMQRLKAVCANPQTWWVGLYAFAIWAPIVVFAGLWGLPFLMARYHIDGGMASLGISILWLGVAVGGPIFGWWSNRIDRRCMPLSVCAFIGMVSAVIAIYLDNLSWPVMCVILFFFGTAASGQSISFGVIQDINHVDAVGTGVGFNNMAVIIGGIFLQPITGLILKMHWDGTMMQGAPVYNLVDYRYALFSVPLCGLIALLTSMFFIKETRCSLKHAKGHGPQEKPSPENNTHLKTISTPSFSST